LINNLTRLQSLLNCFIGSFYSSQNEVPKNTLKLLSNKLWAMTQILTEHWEKKLSMDRLALHPKVSMIIVIQSREVWKLDTSPCKVCVTSRKQS